MRTNAYIFLYMNINTRKVFPFTPFLCKQLNIIIMLYSVPGGRVIKICDAISSPIANRWFQTCDCDFFENPFHQPFRYFMIAKSWIQSTIDDVKSRTCQQARSCLYASTQLNPHYFDKKKLFSRLVEINESKAIHLHFYAKINGFSLVKNALRRPQNAPNFTIYFKIFRGAMPPDPLDYFESTFFIG